MLVRSGGPSCSASERVGVWDDASLPASELREQVSLLTHSLMDK